MTKPGMTNGFSEKGSMNKETTGMNNNGMKKDPNAMPNQDATSHGIRSASARGTAGSEPFGCNSVSNCKIPL